MNNQRFQKGDAVVLRRVWQDRIYRVTTARVVQDTPEMTVLYWGPGYPIKFTRNPLEAMEDMSWELKDGKWGGSSFLLFAFPGDAYVMYAIWDEHRRLEGWYINLQAPLRRMEAGFDTTDYLLDLVVIPDRTSWYWKDEDEFERAAAAGMLTETQVHEIRAEGERALRVFMARPDAFYEHWGQGNAHPDERVPEMPEGWGLPAAGSVPI